MEWITNRNPRIEELEKEEDRYVDILMHHGRFLVCSPHFDYVVISSFIMNHEHPDGKWSCGSAIAWMTLPEKYKGKSNE
jgi:hypothetical protein